MNDSMIDWDLTTIKKIDEHYQNVLNPSIDFIYFTRHFEEIYRLSLDEEELIPDILNDITYYTFNGVNAKYKLLFLSDNDMELSDRMLAKRMKQRANRQYARNNGIDEYYKFIVEEVEDFIEKYPFWKELLRK